MASTTSKVIIYSAKFFGLPYNTDKSYVSWCELVVNENGLWICKDEQDREILWNDIYYLCKFSNGKLILRTTSGAEILYSGIKTIGCDYYDVNEVKDFIKEFNFYQEKYRKMQRPNGATFGEEQLEQLEQAVEEEDEQLAKNFTDLSLELINLLDD